MMNGAKWEIISGDYVSNCLIEAVKAKIRDPKNVKIYICKPRITEYGNFQNIHAMWSDGKSDYDFSYDRYTYTPPYRQLIFRGHIRKFKLGAASRYAKSRNKYGRR